MTHTAEPPMLFAAGIAPLTEDALYAAARAAADRQRALAAEPIPGTGYSVSSETAGHGTADR